MSHSHRWAGFALIAVVAILRLIYLAKFCPLDLAPDEVYYWEWSRHLDWSYHSKGPLAAWLIRISCELLGDTIFAVRFPAVLCGSLLLVGLYFLTLQVYQNEKLALAVTALALTFPAVGAASTLMTIDSPFACAWMWALVFGFRAVFRESRWAWVAAGVCLMLGVLAKYTMVLWAPSFGLFVLSQPAYRSLLSRPGIWVMIGIGCLGGVPIVAWNALNGWATLSHTQMHAGLEAGATIHWFGPLHYLGTQFAMLLGVWFIAWARAVWVHRPSVQARPELCYLWWMSAPVFAFFAMFTLTNGGGEANWPLVSYLSGMVLAAGMVAEEPQHTLTWRRRLYRGGIIAAACLGVLITVSLHEPALMQPILLRIAGPASEHRPTPIRRVDPTARLRGWRHLADEVEVVRAELKTRGIEPVLAAERWTQAAEMGFYCPDRPAFVCLGIPLGDRVSQYDLWRPNPIRDPSDYHGRSFLIVGVGLDRLRPAFASFESPRTVTYRENDCPVAEWTIVVAHGFRGWDRFETSGKD